MSTLAGNVGVSVSDLLFVDFLALVSQTHDASVLDAVVVLAGGDFFNAATELVEVVVRRILKGIVV